jgi:hypothetical protein
MPFVNVFTIVTFISSHKDISSGRPTPPRVERPAGLPTYRYLRPRKQLDSDKLERRYAMIKVTVEITPEALQQINIILRRVYCTLFVILLIAKLVVPAASLMIS